MASTTEIDGISSRSNTQSSQGQPTYDPNVLRGKDGFFSSVYRFFDALSKNRGAMLGVVGGVIVVCAVAGWVMNRNDSRSEAGKNALFLAQKTLEREMKTAAGVPDLAKESAKAPAKADDKAVAAKAAADAAARAAAEKRLETLQFSLLDVDVKFPETVKKYQDVIQQFGDTRAAYEARMALGNLYYQHGEAAKAVTVLKDAVSHAPRGLEKAYAGSALGYALENSGQAAPAVEAFEKALDAAGGQNGASAVAKDAQLGAIRGDLLLSIARNYEILKDTAKARAAYDRIGTELPNSEAAKTAESLKAKL